LALTAEARSYRVRTGRRGAFIRPRNFLLACSLVLILHPLSGLAQKKPAASVTSLQPAPTERDGQHDFDFEIGTWKTHLSRLLNPLTGSAAWVEYDGTTVVRKVWNGRANLVELVADGPAGHFEGLSLRLYNSQSCQWSLNFANAGSGVMAQPTIGEFKNGRASFTTRRHLTAGLFSSALSSRTSPRTLAGSNRRSLKTGARPGK
jgi:hypothetical protein